MSLVWIWKRLIITALLLVNTSNCCWKLGRKSSIIVLVTFFSFFFTLLWRLRASVFYCCDHITSEKTENGFWCANAYSREKVTRNNTFCAKNCTNGLIVHNTHWRGREEGVEGLNKIIMLWWLRGLVGTLNCKQNYFCLILSVKITARTCLTPIPCLIFSAGGHFVNNWPWKTIFCQDFILWAIATFWATSTIRIYPCRASLLSTKIFMW